MGEEIYILNLQMMCFPNKSSYYNLKWISKHMPNKVCDEITYRAFVLKP